MNLFKSKILKTKTVEFLLYGLFNIHKKYLSFLFLSHQLYI